MKTDHHAPICCERAGHTWTHGEFRGIPRTASKLHAARSKAVAKGSKPPKSKVTYGAAWYKQTKNVMPGRRITVKEQLGEHHFLLFSPNFHNLFVCWCALGHLRVYLRGV